MGGTGVGIKVGASVAVGGSGVDVAAGAGTGVEPQPATARQTMTTSAGTSQGFRFISLPPVEWLLSRCGKGAWRRDPASVLCSHELGPVRQSGLMLCPRLMSSVFSKSRIKLKRQRERTLGVTSKRLPLLLDG